MIVLSMYPQEMHNQLVSDAEKVQYMMSKRRSNATRVFRKAKSFPAWYVDEFEIPSSKNKYVLFYYASNMREIEHPQYVHFCIVSDDNNRYVIKGMQIKHKTSPESEALWLPQIHSYTSHFLQRYSERFLHNEELSANEIAGMYFLRNPQPLLISINEEINRNFQKYGEFNNGVRVDDGFCFAQTGIFCEKDIDKNKAADGMLIVYRTFLNLLDMSDAQRDAINKVCLESIKRCKEEF